MPYGFAAYGADDARHGVMAAAAIIFFAFYGFDAVSTAAEETRNPSTGSGSRHPGLDDRRARSSTSAWRRRRWARCRSRISPQVPEPLAHVLRSLGAPGAANLIAAAAIVAMPTVLLAFFYGQTRIFFVMARDGLLPPRLGGVSARGTPVAMTLATAVVITLLAALFPLRRIVELANAGTLAAFIAVSCCVMALRVLEPARPRVFRVPLVWVVGPGRGRGMYLSLLQPARLHAALLPGLECHRTSRCTSCTPSITADSKSPERWTPQLRMKAAGPRSRDPSAVEHMPCGAPL